MMPDEWALMRIRDFEDYFPTYFSTMEIGDEEVFCIKNNWYRIAMIEPPPKEPETKQRDATAEEEAVFERVFNSGRYDEVYQEAGPESTGDMFDPGDWTTKELKRRFPTRWPELDQRRKKAQEASPEWYANAIEEQRKEEQAPD